MVDRISPKMVRAMVIECTNRRHRFQPSHSKAAGVNSTNRVVRYSATHRPISNSADVGPACTAKGYGSRQGWPRSTSNPTTTRKYPRKPVRMAGRTRGWYSLRPKRYTADEMVNPPAARATPVMTSKPIHRPQGFTWSRLVEGPSPTARR